MNATTHRGYRWGLTAMNSRNSLISRSIFQVAPMMEYTDHHQRRLMRLLSKDAVLYTEMVNSGAVTRNWKNTDPFRYSNSLKEDNKRTVIQLGGSCPVEMAAAAKIAHEYGYRRINVNAGCPSPRVASGSFGACLMLEPELLVDVCRRMADVTGMAPSVKCRIGVNDDYEYNRLCDFIRQLNEGAGVTEFIVHARMAILNKSFSPADNRRIPPLKYEVVHQLVNDFPSTFHFSINGGISSYQDAAAHLQNGLKGK
jgi:tRNA-dihydrouridine synthase A